MSRWIRALYHVFLRLAGKDPQAVAVTFFSGETEQCRRVLNEIRQLLPERRHFVVSLEPVDVPGDVWLFQLRPAPPGELYLQLRRALRPWRIGMAAVLFDSRTEGRDLRVAAFLLAPTKILAYNRLLERHHLHWRTPLASFLFWRGVPLDRIWLRPRWLWPRRRDRSVTHSTYREIEGRPWSPARARVAVVTPYFPWPLSHGGAVRIYALLREAAVEFDIVLFAFVESETEPDVGPLPNLCARIVLVRKNRYREPRWSTLNPPEAGEYDSPGMRRALAELLPRFGAPVLQAEYTQLAVYRPDILVEHDITWDLYQQIHSREQSLSSWWNLYRWRRFEQKALRAARRVIVMSEKDRELAATTKAVVIPNGVDLERFQPSLETPGRKLLFVGSFRHFPNLVALRFFLEEIWPLLRDVSLTVVGGPAARQYLDGSGLAALPPGVTLHEFVADVAPLYQESNLAVVPTLVSAGTNLKVLEAMAMRRAIVSTPSGCAGIGLVHGESVWIAESARSFAEGIELLLDDFELRERIAAAARRLAERNYSWRRIGRAQRALFREFSPSPLVIRLATEEDIPAIGRLQDASREASQWNPEDYLRHRTLVAELSGAVAGFVAFREVAVDEIEVLNLVVAPDSRRQGVARRLMETVIEQDCTNLFLEVRESNIPARKLYESLGLLVQGRREHYYHDPPEDAIVMALRKC